MAYTEQTEQVVEATFDTAIPAATTTCAAVLSETVVGPLVCGVLGAIAKALEKLGEWITSEFRDTFHPDKATSEAWKTMIRVHPELLMLNVDRAEDSVAGADLERYFNVMSGEVGPGVKGNNPHVVNNPYYDTGCVNAYQCHEDPDDPLTSPNVLAAVQKRFNDWKASGGGANLKALSKMVPTLHRHPADARVVLALIRKYPKPFQNIAQWSEIQANLNQVQEQLRTMRLLAGEDGPDPGGHLQKIFGGDLTVHQASRDPSMNFSWQHFYPFKWDKKSAHWTPMSSAEVRKADVDFLDELAAQGIVALLTPAQRVEAGLVGKSFAINGVPNQVDAKGKLSVSDVSVLSPDQRVKAGFVGKHVTFAGLSGHIDPQGAFISNKTSSGPGEAKIAGYLALGVVTILTASAFAWFAHED